MIYSNWGNGTTGNVFGDTLTARPTQVTAGTASAIGNFQLWNIDLFAPGLLEGQEELHPGVRRRASPR